MSLWKKIFGSEETFVEKNFQLPSSMVAKEFGEVNVRRKKESTEILFTILMEPQGVESEGWQTGVAIDASASMTSVFGKGLDDGPKGPPPGKLVEEYERKGWLQFEEYEGRSIPILSDQCKADLVERGHFRWTQNEVEPLARRMTAYLASNLDADGGTTVIYWACGDGSEIEVVGDLTAEDCEKAQFKGPSEKGFGGGTVLTPAVHYFAERFKDAKRGMYIFITDGELHDLEEVKRYTIRLCRDIQSKNRYPLKCVLIGVGEGINEEQMAELDDLDSGTQVDVWDHKIARDMRSLMEIFAEVVDEHQIIAPSGRVFDASGQMVMNFPDGLPPKILFSMPISSEWFELEVGGQRIRQSIVVPAT